MEPQSTVPLWLKGAVYFMFACCIGMGSFLVIGIMKSRSFQKARMEKLDRAGYEKIETAAELIVSNAPAKPTWYVASGVKLLHGSEASLALYCATGEISGTVHGDLLFVGRTLIIQPSAVLAGNLETTCWMVKNFGELRGELRGTKNFYVTNQTPLTTGTVRP